MPWLRTSAFRVLGLGYHGLGAIIRAISGSKHSQTHTHAQFEKIFCFSFFGVEKNKNLCWKLTAKVTQGHLLAATNESETLQIHVLWARYYSRRGGFVEIMLA